MTRSRTTAFRRRIYAGPGDFWRDVRYFTGHRRQVRRVLRELIPFAFRERLMMVVTEVNGCRYCSYYHSRQSLESGIPEAELRELLAGSVPTDAPAAELPALLYARHWAETNAHPEPTAVQHLYAVYGEEQAQAIEIVLRMIRMGNLLGNTFDYLLYQATFGLVGLRHDEARYSPHAPQPEQSVSASPEG